MKYRGAKRVIRHQRVRKKVVGTSQVPRITIFRSNYHIYAQLIDDSKNKTLVASSDLKLKNKAHNGKISNVEKSLEVGLDLAQRAIKKNIKKVVFDRGGYKYHGRVKALAVGARKGGLIF